MSNLLAFKNFYQHKKATIISFYHVLTIICTFIGDKFKVITKDDGHLIAFSIINLGCREKTVVTISVIDISRIVSNYVLFNCCVNHRVFNIFLRWNTMNETDFLLQTYNCDKALQKASMHCTLMKIIQPPRRIIYYR